MTKAKETFKVGDILEIVHFTVRVTQVSSKKVTVTIIGVSDYLKSMCGGSEDLLGTDLTYTLRNNGQFVRAGLNLQHKGFRLTHGKES